MMDNSSLKSLNEAKIGIWIWKRDGVINYRGDDSYSQKNVKGTAKDLKEMVEKIGRDFEGRKISWLIRVNPDSEKTFTVEDVEFVRSLDRWGCIADDYELCGSKNNFQTLYDEFYVELKNESKTEIFTNLFMEFKKNRVKNG